MKKEYERRVYRGVVLLAAFVAWTVAVKVVDLRAIGPQGSVVGFGGLNGFLHDLTGVHLSLYVITDWLGLVPFGIALGFTLLGLSQWVRRKSLFKVDRSLLILGGFYLVVIGAYALFEAFVVNYRPVLIQGCLEASYPSSTTMLVLCVMPTAMMEINARIGHPALRRGISASILGFTLFMVVGRLLSGVHWLTDIVGGGLLSGGLVELYRAFGGVECEHR